MRKHFIIFTALILALLAPLYALAQDDGDAPIDAYTFRPIQDIVNQELEVGDFRPDGTATLPITTDIPLACSIIYGTTPEFGSLSVDSDMDGGAHSDHSPLLTGLEANTTYYYRVQGTAPDGTLYLSDVLTFTTPDFSDVEVENLASPLMGAEVTGYSSAFGDAGLDDRWGAGSAFDDNPNTEWSSAGDGNGAWVEVTLASRASITAVEFWSRAMTDGSAITRQFTVTTDDGDTFGPFTVENTEEPFEFDVEIEGQVLRFDLVDTSGGNTGVVNIAVYGEFIE